MYVIASLKETVYICVCVKSRRRFMVRPARTVSHVWDYGKGKRQL